MCTLCYIVNGLAQQQKDCKCSLLICFLSNGDGIENLDKSVRYKNRKVVRTPTHPPKMEFNCESRTQQKKARQEWVCGLARLEPLVAGKSDCGCCLHEEGCYRYALFTNFIYTVETKYFRYALNNVGVVNLVSIAKEEFSHKKEAYEKRHAMLNFAAVHVENSTYDLHYRLNGNIPICRTAYLFFHGLCDGTLRTAETNFCIGKLGWGHSQRRARRSKLNDTMKDEAQDWIRDRVELLAEDQPNSGGLVQGDESDEENCGYMTVVDKDGRWQVVDDIDNVQKRRLKPSTSLPKWKARKHMDPIIKKVRVGCALVCHPSSASMFGCLGAGLVDSLHKRSRK